MSPPLVTVVTATRDRVELLQETVGSVLGQNHDAWEMIVVDDASEDGTWDWLESLGDRRIRAHRMERHAERSAARNLGLRQARGAYVLFLDDDDLLSPSALSTHVGLMSAAPDAVASVGARVMFDDGTGREVMDRIVSRTTVRRVWQDVVYGWVSVAGATLFDADALRRAGGWDETLVIAEDYELWTRVSRQGPIVVAPEVVLRYRVHDGQWRPPDVMGLMEEIRHSALEGVTGVDRTRGEAALAARDAVRRARQRAEVGRHLRAATDLVRARRAAPGLLRSPLLDAVPDARPMSLGRTMAKALVPRFLLQSLRRRRPEAEQASGRDFAARVRSDHDGRFRPEQTEDSHGVEASAGVGGTGREEG